MNLYIYIDIDILWESFPGELCGVIECQLVRVIDDNVISRDQFFIIWLSVQCHAVLHSAGDVQIFKEEPDNLKSIHTMLFTYWKVHELSSSEHFKPCISDLFCSFHLASVTRVSIQF